MLMPAAARDVRCPACSRLLARMRPAGRPSIEIRRGGQVVAVVSDGFVACVCGAEVHVRNEGGKLVVEMSIPPAARGLA